MEFQSKIIKTTTAPKGAVIRELLGKALLHPTI
jgi:hypothetical protein